MRNRTLSVGWSLSLLLVVALTACGSDGQGNPDSEGAADPCLIGGEPGLCVSGPVPAMEVRLIDGAVVVAPLTEDPEVTCTAKEAPDESFRATCTKGGSEFLSIWIGDFGAFRREVVADGYLAMNGLCVVTEDIAGSEFSLSLRFGTVGVAPAEGESCSGD